MHHAEISPVAISRWRQCRIDIRPMTTHPTPTPPVPTPTPPRKGFGKLGNSPPHWMDGNGVSPQQVTVWVALTEWFKTSTRDSWHPQNTSHTERVGGGGGGYQKKKKKGGVGRENRSKRKQTMKFKKEFKKTKRNKKRKRKARERSRARNVVKKRKCEMFEMQL